VQSLKPALQAAIKP